MSNAPSVACASSCDARRTANRSSLIMHGPTDGGRGDLVQLAVGLVVGEYSSSCADAIEGRAKCVPGRLLARRVDRDADERAHVRFDGFEAVESGPRRGSQSDDQERRSRRPRALFLESDPARRRCSTRGTSLRRSAASRGARGGSRATARRSCTRCSWAAAGPASSRRVGRHADGAAHTRVRVVPRAAADGMG